MPYLILHMFVQKILFLCTFVAEIMIRICDFLKNFSKKFKHSAKNHRIWTKFKLNLYCLEKYLYAILTLYTFLPKYEHGNLIFFFLLFSKLKGHNSIKNHRTWLDLYFLLKYLYICNFNFISTSLPKLECGN